MIETVRSYENLFQYPELERAKNLFSRLLKDTNFSLLKSLGYTNDQIGFALPVLKLLLEGKGRINFYKNDPYLDFKKLEESDSELLQLYFLPKKEGVCLSAIRNEVLHRSDLSLEKRVYNLIFENDSVVIFDDFPNQVAQIALFDENADITDLDYLVLNLCSDYFIAIPEGVRKENIWTNAIRAIGATGTYKAVWIDSNRSKLEFVVKLQFPKEIKEFATYVVYKKLEPVRDSFGVMVPFGKVANIKPEDMGKFF